MTLKILADTGIAETTITETTIYQSNNDNVKIQQIKTNGKVTSVRLLTDIKDMTPIMLPEDFDVSNLIHFLDMYIEVIKLKTISDISKGKLYMAYSPGYLLFDENMKIISIPLQFDYTGSLKERYYKDPVYKELIKKLKEHKYVRLLEEKVIPHYNSDFTGQKGISECIVHVEQKQYKKLYEKMKKDKLFSVRMKEVIMCSYSYKDFNLYGKTIEKLLDKYYTEKIERDEEE